MHHSIHNLNRDGDKICFGGAGKRGLNTIVSCPNSTVVYEFRWKTPVTITETVLLIVKAVKKRKAQAPPSEDQAKKKRKKNDGVKVGSESSMSSPKRKLIGKAQTTKMKMKMMTKMMMKMTKRVRQNQRNLCVVILLDLIGQISAEKEDNSTEGETIASRSRRSKRGQGVSDVKKRKKKNKIKVCDHPGS